MESPGSQPVVILYIAHALRANNATSRAMFHNIIEFCGAKDPLRDTILDTDPPQRLRADVTGGA